MLARLLLVLALTTPAFAQRTTATFAGIVADPTNAVLPGAEVQLVNEGTSAAMQNVTNETGEFLFDFVPPGTYTVNTWHELAGPVSEQVTVPAGGVAAWSHKLR